VASIWSNGSYHTTNDQTMSEVRPRFGFAATREDSIERRYERKRDIDQIDRPTGSKKVRKKLDTTDYR
jgi:hypothetical protein